MRIDAGTRELIDFARAVMANAYAPYSGFRVGAAVIDRDGAVFTGANIENASYGLTICAERAAIAAAVSSGAKTIDKIAIYADSQGLTPPCGACRQVLHEFNPHMQVILANTQGAATVFDLAELFPHPFEPLGILK